MKTTDDTGSAAIETAISGVALIAFIFLVISLAGRSVSAKQQTETAAQEAVRAASLQQTPSGAQSAAQAYLDANSAGSDLECVAVIDTSNMVPGELITIELSCTSEVAPNTKATFKATAVEVIDQYRDDQ